MKHRDWTRPAAKKCKVFGGGVTGLTIAHELATRGFEVTVVEPTRDPLRPNMPAVGGAARTHWSCVPATLTRGSAFANIRDDRLEVDSLPTEALPVPILQPTPPPNHQKYALEYGPGPEVYFKTCSTLLEVVKDDAFEQDAQAFCSQIADQIRVYLAKIQHRAPDQNLTAGGPLVGFSVRGFCALEENKLGLDRAKIVAETLIAALTSEDQLYKRDGSILRRRADEVAIARIDSSEGDSTATGLLRPPAWARFARITCSNRLLPGEHGYRFFPSFYRHLSDTMRRTPILEQTPVGQEKGADGQAPMIQRRRASTRTTYDMLRPVLEHGFADSEQPPPRRLPRTLRPSLKNLLDHIAVMQDVFGLSTKDMLLLQLKLLEYLTTSKARRGDLEAKSWSDFISASACDGYSKELTLALDSWPQALVGLKSTEADARTFGTVTCQQMLDLTRSDGAADATLQGPTSTVWLNPWRDYLETLGVRFVVGELKGFDVLEADDGKPTLIAEWCEDGAELRRTDRFDYIALATPVLDTYRLTECSVLRGPLDGLRLLFDGRSHAAVQTDLLNPSPRVPLEHFSGIQYYLSQGFDYFPGHMYYPDAAYGLTSVSQLQFRVDPLANIDSHQGLISVVIADWASVDGQAAWTLERNKLARRVWEQIRTGYMPSQAPTWPRYYHLDRHIKDKLSKSAFERSNSSPYLLTAKDRFRHLPGSLDGYEILKGRLVVAGTFTKTHTRLGTMESANESARHAVNAIMRHARKEIGLPELGTDDCEIFDPEDYEVDDAEWFKRLDSRLHAEGLPHVLEILGAREWIDQLPATGSKDEPGRLVDAFTSLGRAQGALVRGAVARLMTILQP